MYYYLPSTLVSRDMYVGDSLSLLNACFTSLDLGLYTLSTYTDNRINFLSSTTISVSSTLNTRINYLSTTFIAVSSELQRQINNLQISSIDVPNNGVPFFGFTYKDTPYDNFDVALSAKGSGSILAQVPDNTLSGGNKRGSYSVDWQKSRTNASQVVSGNYSFLGGGDSNTVNGNYSLVGGGQNNFNSGNYSFLGGGQNNIVVGDYAGITSGKGNSALSAYSVVIGGLNNVAGSNSFVGGGLNNSALASASIIPGGNGAITYHVGQFSHANGFFASAGDSQFSRFILKGTTDNITPSILLKPSPDTNFSMPNNRVWNMNVKIAGIDTTGAVAKYNQTFITRNLSNTLSAVYGEGIYTDGGTSVNLTVSSNDVVCISALGTSNTWRWTAVIDTVDVAIPV